MEITIKTNNVQDLAMLIQFAKRLNMEVSESQEITSNEMTKLSDDATKTIWDAPENDIWDNFYKQTQQ